MAYKVTGPKGGSIIKSAKLARLRAALPALVKRFGKVSIAKATSPAPKPVPSARVMIVRFAQWGCAHSADIHYAETRPIPLPASRTLPKLPFTTDCSGFVTMAYRYAGAPDPNGNGYDGQGYTGTLLAHGRKITAGAVRPGDVVVYGCKSVPTGHHAAVVTAVGKATAEGIETASHGQESGPFTITVAEEARYQPDGLAGVVYLSFLP
jgi:cell wall-associated NlpC family hydrolase